MVLIRRTTDLPLRLSSSFRRHREDAVLISSPGGLFRQGAKSLQAQSGGREAGDVRAALCAARPAEWRDSCSARHDVNDPRRAGGESPQRPPKRVVHVMARC